MMLAAPRRARLRSQSDSQSRSLMQPCLHNCKSSSGHSSQQPAPIVVAANSPTTPGRNDKQQSAEMISLCVNLSATRRTDAVMDVVGRSTQAPCNALAPRLCSRRTVSLVKTIS
jgi:hypothetical protein